MAKQYFWLKFRIDFFNQPRIKKLRKIAGGDTYVIIYQRLMLESVVNEGHLIFEGLEDTFAEELALKLDEDVENVRFVLLYLQQYGLLEEVTEDKYALPETIENIGSDGKSTPRVQKHRENKKALQCNNDETSCNADETNGNTPCNTEIEKEIELEKDKDKEIDNIITTTTTCEAAEAFNITCGQIPTDAESLKNAADFITQLIRRYWGSTATQYDIERGFTHLYKYTVIDEDTAIGLYDETKAVMLEQAFELAAAKGKAACNWTYIDAIYDKWQRNGIATENDLELHETERVRKKMDLAV